MAQHPAFPLKYSENKRYFVDQDGKPFLYHADTGWQIFVRLTYEEAVEYLTFRKSQGFNTIQVQIVMAPEHESREGYKPFWGDNDFSRPNEAYHDHAARVIAAADSLGLLIVMSQPWLGCCEEAFGGRPDKPIRKNGPAKNRQYGQYLGRKFAEFKNLFWFMGGDNDPQEEREEIMAMAEGLYETAPRHQLISYHARAPHSSTDLFQYAPWLGFSMIYTYWREKPNAWVISDLLPHVYEAALREYSKSDVMPFVLGESQYEGSGVIDNDMGTPHIVRRQAYWTILCGGAGHAYGTDIWNFPDNWRDILHYPGAAQMAHVINLFDSLPWWTLTPDVRHDVVVAGYGEYARPNYVTTGVSLDMRLVVSYLPQLQPLVVNFDALLGSRYVIRWYDPRSGMFAKETEWEKRGVHRLYPPSGEDWVMIIQATDNLV